MRSVLKVVHLGRKSTSSNSIPSASKTCPGLSASVYTFGSLCGWKSPVWRQLSTELIPGGSVKRNTPQLYVAVSPLLCITAHTIMCMMEEQTHSGVLLGAQTIAILSGIIIWYPQWVCRSRLLIKQVCVGCVWIQPSTIKSSAAQ
jgi:hypothetical protein